MADQGHGLARTLLDERLEIAGQPMDVVAGARASAQSVAAQIEKDDAMALGELGRRGPIPGGHVPDQKAVEHDHGWTFAELLDVELYSVIGSELHRTMNSTSWPTRKASICSRSMPATQPARLTELPYSARMRS